MTFFAGHTGTVRLRRNSQVVSFTSQIDAVDVNTTLNRLGFDGSLENILTGDRVTIATNDARKLSCFPAANWPLTLQVEDTFTAYVNVNLYGGLRFFRTFEAAVNNERALELPVATFSGAPIAISVEIEDADYNVAGDVIGFDFQTERDAVDTTSLNDKFKQQYSAGLISGSGSIDALFNPFTSERKESSLLLLQLIQRVEIGSGFSAQLWLTDENTYGSNLDVYYEFDAVITRAGVEVRSDQIISTSIDFLSTGEIALKVGRAQGFVLQQDQGRILTRLFGVDALLQEVDD